MASWLAYLGWRSLWRVFDSIRRYNFASGFPFNSSKTQQAELPSTPLPVCLSVTCLGGPHTENFKVIQLPRLYPIFPADGSKGDTTVDIIAVHGIETTSPKTWIAYKQDTEPKGRPYYWLKDADMLPSVIKGARIWVFDYNSNYSHDAQTVRIDGLATSLLNCILDRHDDFESRKTVFIGSCFGGIVIAEALLTASCDPERKKAVFDQTAGVIFLGSPLRGTKAANFAGWKNFVFGILGPNQESSCTLLDDLKANSSRLESLVAKFGKLTVQSRTQAGMEIRCFYETRTTQVFNSISRNFPIKPEEILLVNKFSACLDCHEHIPLDVRHTMMNKYRGPEDPNFERVSGRIKEVVDKIRTDQSLTREEQECMQALSFPYRDQKDVNPERVKGTCEWFLHHPKFLAWRKENTANLLWVTAGPGCGKSVLSRALVDEGLLYSENPDTKTTSICYFFFKDDAERGSGVNALCSILHQLFWQKPSLIRHAIPDYKRNGPKLPFGTLWDILIKAVADTNAGPVICVFDALDECEPSRRKSLIKYISSFHCASSTTSSKLKFIVTSRPYHELATDFEIDDLPSIYLEGNKVSESIGAEVDLVISHEVSRISNARQPPLDSKTQASLIQHLKEKNNRTYLWVYLMLQEISRSLESKERKLKQLLNTIPRSVDEAYEKILKRATDPVQAKRVLHLVLAAERPLTLKEMNTALEILDLEETGEKCTSEGDLELDEEEAFRKKIENLCGLFISIFDQKIYLIHQTAKEFLTNKNGSTNPWSPSCWKHTFTLEASHLEALKACLWNLQVEFRGSALDPRKDDPYSQLAQDHPLLLYASENWTFHFQQAGEKADKSLRESALRLCDTTSQRFLLWFRILQHQRKFYLEPFNLVPEESSDFMVACYFGLTTAIQLLLERKSDVDVDSKDDSGRTPLSWAARNGYEAVIKLLLNTGKVEVDSKDQWGRTPLSWAAGNGYEAVVKLLLERKSDVDVDSKDDSGQTPLSWAARNGYEAVVKLLLDTGKVEVDSKDQWRQTPLSWAAEDGLEAVVKLLLDTGKVEVDSKDQWRQTPLSSAARNGYEAVVKLLLDTGKVEVDSKDQRGRTPLSWAARNGYEAVVKLLIRTGKVEVDSKDQWGQTPLLCAARMGYEAVVKLLLDTGKVEVDSKDKWGQTPLLCAARMGYEAVVKLLLDTGKIEVDSVDRLYG